MRRDNRRFTQSRPPNIQINKRNRRKAVSLFGGGRWIREPRAKNMPPACFCGHWPPPYFFAPGIVFLKKY